MILASPFDSDRAGFHGWLRARPIKPTGTAGTLAELRNVRPDVQRGEGRTGARSGYAAIPALPSGAPETAMTPEAIRRLADLQLEKQFGIRGGNAKPRKWAAPKPAQVLAGTAGWHFQSGRGSCQRGLQESDRISSGARQRRLESWRAVTPAACRRTRRALAQIPRVHSRRSLSIIGLLTETPVTRTVTRSSIRWRGRTTSSGAPTRPSRQWSA